MAVVRDVLLLDGLDVEAFLHLPCEVLLVVGREEVDLADFAQVHAHGVIDALGLLGQEGETGVFLLLLLFLVGRSLFFVFGRDFVQVVVGGLVIGERGEAAEHAVDNGPIARRGRAGKDIFCHVL